MIAPGEALHVVCEEFERNFRERGEVGASVCVVVDGEAVVDLWGGIARPDTGTPWLRDTVGIIFSSTMGATALCAHILASRGATPDPALGDLEVLRHARDAHGDAAT